jgi:release factor glutamine methyltransferase
VVAEGPGTVGVALEAAARRLRSAGNPQGRREAAHLAEAAWGLAPGQARIGWDRALPAEAADHLAALVTRRVAGEPLAHVTGVAGFRHLLLASDRRALIPRPETEGLVALVLERMSVLGVDCSGDALALARENAARTGLHVEWRQGDLIAPLAGERLDVLVANPPYLTRAEFETLDSSVRGWEPSLALESGADGLAATRRLLAAGLDVVKPGGWIALEVDCERAAAVARLATRFGWMNPVVYQDLYGRARYVLARRSETS